MTEKDYLRRYKQEIANTGRDITDAECAAFLAGFRDGQNALGEST